MIVQLQQFQMISFAKQLSELFSFAGYKTQGIWMSTKLEYLPSNNYERLTYKCDIANQFYEHYKEFGFRYNEKGITPKVIAQEIQIFTRQSSDFSIRINSFGNFLIEPTLEYMERFYKNILQVERIENLRISAPHLKEEEWGKDRRKMFIMDLQDGSISDLRVFYYLLLLKRKAKVFGDFRQQLVDWRLDISELPQNRRQIIKKQILYSTELQLLEKRQKYLQIDERDQTVAGVLRYLTIPFEKKYKTILSPTSKLIPFGNILPNLPIQRLINIKSKSIKDILKFSLLYNTHIPINLHRPVTPCQLILRQNMKGRTNIQTLLILLDELQQDNFHEVYQLIKKITAQNIDFKPFKIMQNQIQMIL